MWGLVSMIVMSCLWQGRRVTLYQQGKVFAIGRVIFVSDQWLNIRDVEMANSVHKGRLAVSRNRVDAYWYYHEGDEKLLAPIGILDEPALRLVMEGDEDSAEG